jgi:hypothetical protein
VVNLLGWQANQTAAQLVRQPAHGDRDTGRRPTLATPGGPRLAPRLLQPGQIARGGSPDAGGRSHADQIAPDPRLVGGWCRQPECARRRRRPPGRFGRRQPSGGDRQHAYARASASAADRKLRMYCTIENSETAVET